MDNRIIINEKISLIEALRIMDEIERKLLIICRNKLFIGVISIGDIQRAIIDKNDLNDSVRNHIRTDITYATTNDDISLIQDMMKRNRIECMPIINEKNELVDIINWQDIFEAESIPIRSVHCPVVIMAGGKGERLKPLTNFLPKPLVPVSDKTIIEEIIDTFLAVSCNVFYLSVNYKADTIKEYFDNIKDKKYSVNYIKEDIPLGTAGSLWLLKDKIHERFIVSNCDALIDIDLYDLVQFHEKNNNIATMVSVVKQIDIPYGVIETAENGELVSLKEKPDFIYQVNCGLYVFEPEVLKYIEDNSFLNITDFLIRLKENGHRVGVFPISPKCWRDMGNWPEYLKMISQNV